MLIFHQGQAQISFAGLAEAAAGTDRHFGFFNQFHGEIDGAHALTPFQWITRPDKHTGFRFLHFPADALQAVDSDVAAQLIFGRLTLDLLLALAEGDDASDLDWL